MGKALYRKHRPKKLSEVIGQTHVTDTLSHALKQGNVSHAYLLTGPKGVGKTSIARILAYEVNGLPYDEEGSHLDIIEIDAASNRRIDEIRELKERINIAPTSAKYKVYIIDEVHMLTKEAFNALLKTLEEPPEHAIFILATTEAHKVPETIISRTQRFSLKPIENSQVTKHLAGIAKSEKIDISDEALRLVAEHGEGSFRDSLSLLDQMKHSSKEIELEAVENALGLAPTTLLSDLMNNIQARDLSDISKTLEKLKARGSQPAQLASQLNKLMRKSILTGKSTDAGQDLSLMEKLLSVSSSSDPGLALELALYEICLAESSEQADSVQPEPKNEPTKSRKPVSPALDTKIIESEPAKIEGIMELNQETWASVLEALRSKHNTLYSVTRMASPDFEEGKVTLRFAFAFHQKKLADSKSQQILKDVIKQTTGQTVLINCVLEEPSSSTAETLEPSTSKVNLETISNIFGGAEIVE